MKNYRTDFKRIRTLTKRVLYVCDLHAHRKANVFFPPYFGCFKNIQIVFYCVSLAYEHVAFGGWMGGANVYRAVVKIIK